MIWKHVTLPSYEKYEISTDGNVRNSETGRILHPTLNGNKSVCVNLHGTDGHNKLLLLRNLVYNTYIGKADGMVITHINGNVFDCAPRNLRLKVVETSQEKGVKHSNDSHTIKGIWDQIMREQMPESYQTIWGHG